MVGEYDRRERYRPDRGHFAERGMLVNCGDLELLHTGGGLFSGSMMLGVDKSAWRDLPESSKGVVRQRLMDLHRWVESTVESQRSAVDDLHFRRDGGVGDGG